MKHKKKIFYFAVFFLPILLFLIIATITNHLPFGNYIFNIYDGYVMYPSLLTHTIRSIKTNEIFFTFFAGMGTDFYNIKNLYMNSPLNLFFLFFKENMVFEFYTLLMYLRIGLSSLTMSIFLNSIAKDKDKYSMKQFIFSLIYSFTTYSIACSMHIMWMDSYILLPLIIMGLERILNDKKINLYVLFLSLAIIINYYIGYMLCIFIVIYFIYRMLIEKKFKWKYISKFLIGSLLSGLIASFVLIPAVFNLMGARGDYFDITSLFGIDTISLTSYLYNYFPGSYMITDNMYGSAVSYCSLLVLVLNILYYLNKKIDKKEKLITLIFVVFFILSSFIKFIDYSWNMFQAPVWWPHRYYFVVSFFLILVAYRNFDRVTEFNVSYKNKCIICFVVISTLLISITFKLNYMLAFVNNIYYIYLILGIIIFLMYLALIAKKKYRFILYILLIIELGFNSYVVMDNFKQITLDEARQYVNKAEEYKELLEYDNSFYRFDVINDNEDDSLLYGYNSSSLFSSSYNKNVNDFFVNTGVTKEKSINRVLINYYNPAVTSLLNIKYLYGNSDYYEKTQLENFYLNKNALSVGYVVPDSIKKLSLTDDSSSNIENIYSVLAGEDVKLFYDIGEIQNKEMKNLEYDEDNYIVPVENDIISDEGETFYRYEFIANKSGVLVPNNVSYLDYLQVFINDEKISFSDDSDRIIQVKKDDKVFIDYTFNVTNDLYTSKNIDDDFYFKIMDINKVNKILKKLSTNTQLINIETDEHVLKGNISCNEDNTLFLSIPYYDSFTIKVDGESVDYFKIYDAFIGIDLVEGEHEITIDYIPKGLRLGIIMSVLGIIIWVVLIFFKKV